MFCINILLLLSFIGFGAPASVINHGHRNTWCYDHSRDFYPYFASRMPYQPVQGNLSRIEPAGCAPLQLLMIPRHGTRYPDVYDQTGMLELINVRDEILRNREVGVGPVCNEVLERLRNWQPERLLSNETLNILAPQGIEDMRTLAGRLQRTFPELLPSDVNEIKPEDYVFRHTVVPRTLQSLEAFQYGLFGNSNVLSPPLSDPEFWPYLCPVWSAEMKRRHISAERDKFTAGPEVHNLVIRLSSRLGFARSLDFQTVESMYNLCRYEMSLFINETSVWCTIFSKEDLQIMEYREDLSTYYSRGPGFPLSAKHGCHLLSSMFHSFRKVIAEELANEPKGVFYFAHSLPIQSLLAAMKFYDQSEPLTWTGFATAQNRTYRTSLFGPFSANIAFVLYRCDTGDQIESHKVAFYVNENLVTIPGCKDKLCDWEDLEKSLGAIADSCENICHKPEEENVQSSATQHVTSFTSAVIVSIVFGIRNWMMYIN